MHVKKYEARTMKEALEMVKAELGPQAVILSARDNQKSYGLVGEKSVEVTAAISETTLKMKKFTEAKMTEDTRKKFQQAPARAQNQVIEKVVNKHLMANSPAKGISQVRYIDIDDEQAAELQPFSASPAKMSLGRRLGGLGAGANSTEGAQELKARDSEILSLKQEIYSLKKTLQSFGDMPQSFVSQYPGASYGISYDLSFMWEKLSSAGVSEEYSAEILTRAQQMLTPIHLKKKSMAEAFVTQYILSDVRTSDASLKNKTHIFVGAGGHGKTSSLIKTASHLVLHEKRRIAILSTDTFKVGATEQLKIYAQILNVPFVVVRSHADWKALETQLDHIDYVLVDCPGLSLKNQNEIAALKAILPPSQWGAKIHLVLSATAKDQDAAELTRRYSAFSPCDFIFTALDESAQHGVIYNLQKKYDLPLLAFGIGPNMPEDYEMASKERVLDLIFKISNEREG